MAQLEIMCYNVQTKMMVQNLSVSMSSFCSPTKKKGKHVLKSSYFEVKTVNDI